MNTKEALKHTRKEEIALFLGYFNAKVGCGHDDDTVERYGIGVQNEGGEALVQFCKEFNFIITNTWFKQPPMRLYTWKSPADNDRHIVINQIDFITMRKTFRNSITSVKTYPGADVQSDHNLLRLKKLTKSKRAERMETEKI
ncbi:hypothetical protein HUJ05_003316 [Dendroctonus ponderosae]|nr:hypothetical protein HUJ05_003316 [Dendroctonus ponderosae]